MGTRLRRILSLAPLPLTESLSVFATGAALWGFVVVTTRPDWVPQPTGWLLSLVGMACVARALAGFVATAGGSVQTPNFGPWRIKHSPRTTAENARVLAKRPAGWRYLYFAGCLTLGRATLDRSYLDHDLRYAAPSGERIEDGGIEEYLHGAIDDVLQRIATFMALAEPDVQKRTFASDAEAARVEHLAEKWTEVYGDLMKWAARLRGANKPERYRPLFEKVARLIDGPIQQYRGLVDDYVREADTIPEATAKNKPLRISVEITLRLDDEASRDLSEEIDRLKAENAGAQSGRR